jgi:hypothetical protein
MCWPWKHKWTKWKATQVGELLERDSINGVQLESRHPTGRYEIQRRECEVCGKSQLRGTRT